MTPEDRKELAELSRKLADETDANSFGDMLRGLNDLLERNLSELRENNRPYKSR